MTWTDEVVETDFTLLINIMDVTCMNNTYDNYDAIIFIL